MVQMLELISTDLSDCRISNSSKYTLLNISSSSLTTLEWVRERERVRVRVRARERESERESERERGSESTGECLLPYAEYSFLNLLFRVLVRQMTYQLFRVRRWSDWTTVRRHSLENKSNAQRLERPEI